MKYWIAVAGVLALSACQSSGNEGKMFAAGTRTPQAEATPEGGEMAAVEGADDQGAPVLPELKPIRYTVSFPQPQTHYAQIEAVFPVEDDADSVELFMATWTPGSYLIREYERHIDRISASTSDGTPLSIVKTKKNHWVVQADGQSEVVVRYRLYCREMSVRTNWVEADFAMLNGAPTFVTLADLRPRPHDVRFKMPATWRRSFTAMSRHPDGDTHHYRAESYDELVDSPVLLGNAASYDFSVGDTRYTLVNQGEGTVWAGPRSASDVEKLVAEQTRFWGGAPMDRYFFLNVLSETGGGLEHKKSTLIMGSRWATRKRDDYLSWLRLVSHEFFHTWNVKRLRPRALGPFDYENETYTKSLWVAEGITSYYDRLLVHRAGLSTEQEFLTQFSQRIAGHLNRPGRKVQPLEDASYDAWIKYYRGNENSGNSTVSYYVKGSVVAFLLDAKIRKLTEGERSLDDVMRKAYELYSGKQGYTPEQFRAVVNEVAGQDLSAWLHKALETTEDLDFDEALDWYGLELADQTPTPEGVQTPESGWLGVNVRADDGRIRVSSVVADSPAFQSGINAEDEIIGIDGYRIEPGKLAEHLTRYQPGARITVLVSRRGELTEIPTVLGQRPRMTWTLVIKPEATADQQAHRAAWLNGDREAT